MMYEPGDHPVEKLYIDECLAGHLLAIWVDNFPKMRNNFPH